MTDVHVKVVLAKPDAMSDDQGRAVVSVASEVVQERFAQHEKYGERNYPNFPPQTPEQVLISKREAADARAVCQRAFAEGIGSYGHILQEEIYEAWAEYDDPQALRAELIQVAAVAVAWVEKIDRDAAKGED